MNKKSYAVIGLGKFGESIAIELAKAGADVLALDNDAEKVHEVASYVTRSMQVDVCDVETMNTLGLSNMDAVIVAITGNLNASVMATILCKEAGVPYIIAKVGDNIQATILKKVGADRVIIPEKESGIRVAQTILSTNLKEFIELSDKINIIEVNIRPEWIGKSLKELSLRQKYNIYVIGIRENNELKMNINPDKTFENNCTLLVVINKEDIPKLMKKYKS